MQSCFKYIAGALLIVLLIISCGQRQSLPSLNETYGYEDKKPFGGFVAFTYIKQLLENRFIDANTKPFDASWKEMKAYSTNTKHSLYIIITKNLLLTEAETKALIDYVSEGNDLFVSVDYIDDDFLKRVKLKLSRRRELDAEIEGSFDTSTLSVQTANGDSSFNYYYFPFFNAFNNYDSTATKVLGKNQTGEPNYVAIFIGKGRLYLHTAPRAFSNYFLLTKNNSHYLRIAFSYLRPDPKNIFWDDYYSSHSTTKRQNDNGKSPKDSNFSALGVIKKNPPLWSGFLLVVALLLLFVLFNIRRKQRSIKVIKPVENTTVQFAETMGRLYLQKKDNKNIAEKMIAYFYGHLRNKYFLTSEPGSKEFQLLLSRKTGESMVDTEKLLNTINRINANDLVSEDELLDLNKQIEHFTNK
ncbi:MAG: DUF4350 domain-containing protein [Ginsengibacter sp.]